MRPDAGRIRALAADLEAEGERALAGVARRAAAEVEREALADPA
jgi:hypothetical protein